MADQQQPDQIPDSLEASIRRLDEVEARPTTTRLWLVWKEVGLDPYADAGMLVYGVYDSPIKAAANLRSDNDHITEVEMNVPIPIEAIVGYEQKPVK